MRKFGYQSEKFSAARSALMLPHPRGESESIVAAFSACSRGLRDLDIDSFDENVCNWIQKINEFMDVDDLSDQDSRGLWAIKADSLTEAQKFELAQAVDELAHYFNREFWSTNM